LVSKAALATTNYQGTSAAGDGPSPTRIQGGESS